MNSKGGAPMSMREQIKPRRVALGIKPPRLAVLAGVSAPTVRNIENEPGVYVAPETIAKVWRALDDYEAAGNRPVSMTSDDDAEWKRKVMDRFDALEAELGMEPVNPAELSSLSLVDLIEARFARIESALAKGLTPKRTAPSERQPSGSLNQSIAAQRQRGTRRPSKCPPPPAGPQPLRNVQDHIKGVQQRFVVA